MKKPKKPLLRSKFFSIIKRRGFDSLWVRHTYYNAFSPLHSDFKWMTRETYKMMGYTLRKSVLWKLPDPRMKELKNFITKQDREILKLNERLPIRKLKTIIEENLKKNK